MDAMPSEAPDTKHVIRDYPGWWIGMAVVSFMVGLFTLGGMAGAIGYTVGAFLIPGFFAGLAWLFWKLVRRPLSAAQFLSVFVVAWSLVMILGLIGRTMRVSP